MPPKTGSATQRHGRLPGRVALTLALLCFGLFILNVLVGKASAATGWQAPFMLGDVVQFCLILASSTALIVAALQRERAGGEAG